MSSPFKTKQFEKLKDKWYKKLEKEGFVDVEQDENNLKQWESSIFSRYNEHTIASKEEYYRLAGQFLHKHTFKSERHRSIWSLHSEGLSLDDISLRLKKLKLRPWSRSAIHLIVQDLSREMMTKYGNPIGSKRLNSH